MEDISGTERAESIEALQSAIRKSQKALAQMAEKGASTTLVERSRAMLMLRLIAVSVLPSFGHVPVTASVVQPLRRMRCSTRVRSISAWRYVSHISFANRRLISHWAVSTYQAASVRMSWRSATA